MFGAARAWAKVLGKRVVRRHSRNSEQVCSSTRGRRLRLESLEDRRLLAIGDLLQSFVDPGTVDVQPDGDFGTALAADGDLTVIGTPYAAVGGVSSVGVAYVFSTNSGELLATLNNPEPTEHDFFGEHVAVSGNMVVVGATCDDAGG